METQKLLAIKLSVMRISPGGCGGSITSSFLLDLSRHQRHHGNIERQRYLQDTLIIKVGFPHSSVGKESACNAGDSGSILGLGRSPGEGNGNPLQNSCLDNPMDRGAWRATVHGVTKSRTRLSEFTSLVFIRQLYPEVHL